VIPVHGGRDIQKPLLQKILADAGIAFDDFLKLL
jgi:predicted RNA binding protein YcfA (HicA-like mRNA interferase family)